MDIENIKEISDLIAEYMDIVRKRKKIVDTNNIELSDIHGNRTSMHVLDSKNNIFVKAISAMTEEVDSDMDDIERQLNQAVDIYCKNIQ